MTSEPKTEQLNTAYLPLTALVESPFQPRKDYEPKALEELAADIRMNGIRCPLAVRPLADGTFELMAGHRRHRAAGMAHLEVVPCIIRDLNDREAEEFTLFDNMSREDLTPWDAGQGFADLVARGVDTTTIGAKIGKGREYIEGRIALTALGEEARRAYLDAAITLGNLSLVAKLPDRPLNFADCPACNYRVNSDAGGTCPSCLSSLEGVEWQAGGNAQTVAVRGAKGKPSGVAQQVIWRIIEVYGLGVVTGQGVMDLGDLLRTDPEVVAAKGRLEAALGAIAKECQWAVDHKDLLAKLPGEQQAAIRAQAEAGVRALRFVQEAVSVQEAMAI